VWLLSIAEPGYCLLRTGCKLPPLKDRHINFLGRYLFNIKPSVPGQGLRPFRAPDTTEEDEALG
jgi:hypothetical protein